MRMNTARQRMRTSGTEAKRLGSPSGACPTADLQRVPARVNLIKTFYSTEAQEGEPVPTAGRCAVSFPAAAEGRPGLLGRVPSSLRCEEMEELPAW